MEKSIKNLIKFIVFVLVLVVLYFILKEIGFIKIYDNLKIAKVKYIVLAFLSGFVLFITWNLKWYLLLKELTDVKFRHTLLILLAGSFVNSTTPGARVGGEPLRAYYLSKIYNVEKSRFFATTLIDKVANTVAFSFLSIFSILFVILFVDIGLKLKVFLEIILLLILVLILGSVVLKKKIIFKKRYITKILLVVYNFFLFRFVRKKFSTYKKFEGYFVERFDNIVNTSKRLLYQKKIFKNTLILSFVMWFFNYIGTYFLFKAFSYDVSFLAVIIVVTLSLLIGSIIFVPGGIGLIETVMISLYFSFGIGSSIAATVAVVDRFIFYFFSLFVGGLCLAYLNIRYK